MQISSETFILRHFPHVYYINGDHSAMVKIADDDVSYGFSNQTMSGRYISEFQINEKRILTWCEENIHNEYVYHHGKIYFPVADNLILLRLTE